MTASQPKARVFSGIQPTGKLHLGNYIGALRAWVANQSRYDSIFCIVDLHALTIPEAVRPDDLRRQIRAAAALLLACGIDPAQCTIFVQSHVAAHAELTWLLNCVTPIGWLERMTQYKSKAAQLETVSTALLDYPVLQAADILLYQTDLVPVGEDQKQHVELARDVAQRFHALFGPAFVIPKPMIPARGARILGLDDPTVKMSKSLGEVRKGHAIGLTDSPDVIRGAIMGAVTDSGTAVRSDRASPGIVNLLAIYEALSGEGRAETAARFEGKGYSLLKRAVADVVVATLAPIRERSARLLEDRAELDRILTEGAGRARPMAEATLDRVKQVMGLDRSPAR